MKLNGEKYRAGLYCRISKEDTGSTESSSIATQREMLCRFANEQGFEIYDIYIDDGYSGTNFNRPAFLKLQHDIDTGFVNAVIVKDLSRLGRDYIANGQLLEQHFPRHNCRFITLTDGYDSENEQSADIAPFRNVINELYARDISKKIRSAFLSRMQAGQYIAAFAPYGYMKDPQDKHRLLPDPNTAPVVAYIFDSLVNGSRPTDVARQLNLRGLPPPSVYRDGSKQGLWTGAAVRKISGRLTYAGHTVQHKTTKLSFKSSVTVKNDKSDWIIVKNTHEPLVTEQLFDAVGKILSRRKTPSGNAFKNIFSGLAFCADCKRSMSVTAGRRGRYNLVCGGYKQYGAARCSNHCIGYDDLCAVLSDTLERYAVLPDGDGKDRTKTALNKSNYLRILQDRADKLQTVIARLYEDKYLGNISDKRFEILINQYNQREKQIKHDIAAAQSDINKPGGIENGTYKDQNGRLKSCAPLTAAVLHSLIERIDVHRRGQSESQRLDIYLKLKK